MDVRIELAKNLAIEAKPASPRSQYNRLLDEIVLLEAEHIENTIKNQWVSLVKELLSHMPAREQVVNADQKTLRTQAEELLSRLEDKTPVRIETIFRGRRTRCDSLDDKARQFQDAVQKFKREMALSGRAESPKPIKSPSFDESIFVPKAAQNKIPVSQAEHILSTQ